MAPSSGAGRSNPGRAPCRANWRQRWGGSWAELGKPIEGVFIRAPRIRRVGRGVQVFATYRGEPVGVRAGRIAAITFHPELTPDRRLHEWFVREVAGLAFSRSA